MTIPTQAPYPTITAKIICDSIGHTVPRLTTFELTYPRYIHAEIMTHRVLSRNAQSSRAIPVKRRLERVRENPVQPIRWGANQAGMQAKDLEVEDPEACLINWIDAAASAADRADELMSLGLHKQWANRLLEPFDTITVVATATEWDNLFGLRCHPDAQPEFQNLAWKMADLYFNEIPTHLTEGQWHVPYVDNYRQEAGDSMELVKASVARCARVSYLNHDGSNCTLEKDLALHDSLLKSGHMSPFEHQAMVLAQGVYAEKQLNHMAGNFSHGWGQYRKLLAAPELRTFDYHQAVADGKRPWSETYTGEGNA